MLQSKSASYGQFNRFGPKRLYYREPVSICSVLAKCDVFLVDFELLAASFENNQLVSSSKFKLVCQVVKAKKAKEKQGHSSSVKGSYRVVLLT